MRKNKARATRLAGMLAVLGLVGFVGGLAWADAPAWIIKGGYLLLALGILLAILADGMWRLKTFWFFLGFWVFGGVATAGPIFPDALEAVLCTAIVHLPLLALACRIARRKSGVRFLSVLFHPLSLFLAVLLPLFMMIDFDAQPKQREPDEIEVTADNLADKNPAFVDEPGMWQELPVTVRYGDAVTCTINKSAAVIGLDMEPVAEAEQAVNDLLFATYKDAIAYANDHDIALVPSVQMVDHKAKVFADDFYGSIERYLQNEASALGGGKRVLFAALLEQLVRRADADPAARAAAARVAAGLRLGGVPVTDLPPEIDATAAKLADAFRATPLKSKPIGFYAESEDLSAIFRQDRFYQDPIDPPQVCAMARVLMENPALRRQYKAVLRTYARLTNPPARFSVDDAAEHTAALDTPAALQQALMGSAKWQALCKRGADREPGGPSVQLLPFSTSKENELFATLYNVSGELPKGNIMNALIQAVRSGKLDLTPDEESGWYDYQIHALEALLVPERGQEGVKLFLSETYKKRLIEAFKTILTKKRELHAKQVGLLKARGGGPQKPFIIAPVLSLEPTATYYLRTARGLRFVSNALAAIHGEGALGAARLSNGQPLGKSAERMIALFYGLYLRVCDEIGMKPVLLWDEMPEPMQANARQTAAAWLQERDTDPCYETDVRFIVPGLSNERGSRVRYWMTCGVRLAKLKAEYVKRPTLRFADVETGKLLEELGPDSESGYLKEIPISYKYAPTRLWLPVEVFAEADGSAEPMTRKEFRALCDGCRTKEEIVAAVGGRAESGKRKLLLAVLGICAACALGVWLAIKARGTRKV